MFRLAAEYSLFVFVAGVGVLQATVTHSGLWGLCFFRRSWQGYLFAMASIAAAFAWFFLSYDRNRPGLEGLEQVLLFSLASAGAVAFTLTVSSVLKRKEKAAPRGRGLEALREASYWQAWRHGRGDGDAPR